MAYEDLIPVLGITEVEVMREQLALKQAWQELQAMPSYVERFKDGLPVLFEGEPIWWTLLSGRRLPGVFWAFIDGKAGIACRSIDGTWLPYQVTIARISSRLTD